MSLLGIVQIRFIACVRKLVNLEDYVIRDPAMAQAETPLSSQGKEALRCKMLLMSVVFSLQMISFMNQYLILCYLNLF